ncbi:MAG: hypothetical protein IT165_35780 [Bryobacterales bacterium]|nr:hypothetical protein [Bryobacterales bacterium]
MSRLRFENMPGGWHTVDYTSVQLTKVSWESTPSHALAYVFFGHVNIDFDGSPTAYGPPGIQPPPDDCLGNAGNARDGWFGVLALDPNDPQVAPLVRSGRILIDSKAPVFLNQQPVIQQARNGDPKPGYYVSTTPRNWSRPLRPERRLPNYLQNMYTDSSQVTYGALDGALRALGVSMGDFGLAIRHDQNLQSGFYFADAGANKHALGECSHKVAKNLGSTRRVGVDCTTSSALWTNNFPVSFIVFPNSRTTIENLRDLSERTVEGGLHPRLAELSKAGNAEELALLMAFNEGPPKVAPDGKAKLDQFLKNPGAKPQNFATILLGLATFGFWPFPKVPREKTTPFDSPLARP